ncbi:MAG TPA: hypothetical protein VH722_15310 [Alphaproteobacteria bacterium]|jgi:hypothetical protein|nr:hypothetical protein [Alphaproteobacteria bacterium]
MSGTNEIGANLAARPSSRTIESRSRDLFLVMGGRVMDARLVGMLMGMQAVAVRDMGVVRRLMVVARLVMACRFVMVPGGLLVVMGGLAVMFSAFVTCRHIHVLRKVITL